MPAIQNSTEVEARESEVQGFPWLQRDFEASLKKKWCPDLKNKTKQKQQGRGKYPHLQLYLTCLSHKEGCPVSTVVYLTVTSLPQILILCFTVISLCSNLLPNCKSSGFQSTVQEFLPGLGLRSIFRGSPKSPLYQFHICVSSDSSYLLCLRYVLQ